MKCGDYSCHRQATQVPAGAIIREPYNAGNLTAEDIEYDRRQQAVRLIKCNRHVGAAKRTTYGGVKDWEPIEMRPDIYALATAHYEWVKAEEDKAATKRRAEARQKGEARYSEEWAGWGEDKYVVANQTDEYPRENAGVRNLTVRAEGANPSIWNEWNITTEQSTRFDDLPMPVYVRVNRTGTMTPNEARALARALNLMADRVDAANSLIRQNAEA